MDVYILKTIFVPDISFIKINIDSISSLLNICNMLDIYKFTIRYEGYIEKNIYDIFINDLYKIQNPKHNIKYYFHSHNVGKKYILINASKEINYNKYIYIDHDIILTSSIYYFLLHNITIIDTKLDDGRIIKMLSFNQLLDNRHNKSAYQYKININNINICYSINNIYIASGCFIVAECVWKLFGTIENKCIYGDEDIILGELLNINNFANVIIYDYNIIHPFEINNKYIIWKNNQIFIKSIEQIN